MYSIIRTKKHKSISSLRFRENHTYRKHPAPNADPEKQHRNKLLWGQANYADGVDTALKEYVIAGNKIRKNGVLTIEYLLTASPEFFDEGPKHERDARLKEWCDLQVKFLKEKHGEKNIQCMYLHLDEKTPHIEAYVVPIDPRGKLNCKHFLGGRAQLRDLQTQYAIYHSHMGLKRGQQGSRATHEEVKKFYAQIKTKAKVTSQDLQRAVKIDAPKISERLDPSSFVETQQKKIFDRVSKLFAGTVYENKLIQQAKKILREWVRAEQDAQKMRYKLESEKDALKDKLDRQTKILSQLDKLTVENKDLQKQLQSSEVENQLLKNKFLPQQTKTVPK